MASGYPLWCISCNPESEFKLLIENDLSIPLHHRIFSSLYLRYKVISARAKFFPAGLAYSPLNPSTRASFSKRDRKTNPRAANFSRAQLAPDLERTAQGDAEVKRSSEMMRFLHPGSNLSCARPRPEPRWVQFSQTRVGTTFPPRSANRSRRLVG